MNENQVDTLGMVLAMNAIVRMLLINAARDGQDSLGAVTSWKAAVVGKFEKDYASGPLAGNRVLEAAISNATNMFDEALHAAGAVKHSGH
jgi:hypothetical protein